MEQHFALFETAIGTCGIVWTVRGVCGMQLPEKDAAATLARVHHRHPTAVETTPPTHVLHAIDGVVALLAGEKRDLRDIQVDDEGQADFNKRVYAIVRQVPPGSTMTYGEVAERLGDKTLARAVGQAMGENPTPVIMPCHRVMAAGGKTGGFSAPGGIVTKLQLLTIEGAEPSGPTLFEHLPLQVAARRRG